MVSHLSHVHILGTHHCGKEHIEAFQCRGFYQDLTCCHEYEKGLVEIFSNQIQSEYFGGSMSVSMEVISLETFCVQKHLNLPSVKNNPSSHAVFHSFCMITENRTLQL